MSNVCTACIGEEFLCEQITQTGNVACCDYCHSEENPTIKLADLAEQVHSVLEDHYYMTSPDPEGVDLMASKEGYWEQPGEPVTYAIINLIDSTEEVAESIRDYLSEKYDPAGEDTFFHPCPYDSDSQYEERPINTYDFQETWTSFRQEILSRSRFFNEAARSALEHLFSGIEQVTTHDGDPVIRVYGSADDIYRARVAKTDSDLEKTLKEAPRSLGAPPGRYASAGRMNAEGISVFYGATDTNTCIAEIRAPVGSLVVIGRFMPVRGLRLLDLTLLNRVFLRGSLFDPEHSESLSRMHFLKRLVEEISQPVLPGTESREYLPTQAVVEYLGSHPDMRLDGVIFTSSQISSSESANMDSDSQQTGKNIVLFSHACGLENYEIPDGTAIDVSQSFGDPDEPEHSFCIWETVPERPEKEESANPQSVVDDLSDFMSPFDQTEAEHVDDLYEPSLQLDMQNIEVRKIEGVSYQSHSLDVTRYRRTSTDINF